jgi:hypothetical protein
VIVAVRLISELFFPLVLQAQACGVLEGLIFQTKPEIIENATKVYWSDKG